MEGEVITMKDYSFQKIFKHLMTLINNCGVYYKDPTRDKVRGKCLGAVSFVITVLTLVLGWFETVRIGWLTNWKNLASPREASKAMFFILHFYNVCFHSVVNISWRHFTLVYFEKLERSKIRLTRRAHLTLWLILGSWIMILFLVAVYVPYNIISSITADKRNDSLVIYLRMAPLVQGTVLWDIGLILYCLHMAFVYIRLGVTFSFLALAAYHIGMEFESVKQRLKRKQYDIQILEMIREEYEDAISLVDTLESMFSSGTLVTYVCCLPLLCFTVYSFQKLDPSPDGKVIAVNALARSLLPAAVITLSGPYINSMSACFVDLLHGIRVSAKDEKASRSLQMFTSQVVTSQVGITAMRLFIVTKATILSMAGTVITYVVIVVQMSPYPTGPAYPNGNTTCTC